MIVHSKNVVLMLEEKNRVDERNVGRTDKKY
jgi:hypothetical protein